VIHRFDHFMHKRFQLSENNPNERFHRCSVCSNIASNIFLSIAISVSVYSYLLFLVLLSLLLLLLMLLLLHIDNSYSYLTTIISAPITVPKI
jgi:hypothetical protein